MRNNENKHSGGVSCSACNTSSLDRLYGYTWSMLICFYFLKKNHLVQFFENKAFFFVILVFFPLKSSMASFLEYILD